MKRLLIVNAFLFFHLSTIWAQVDNTDILYKLRHIENDTVAFINIINKPYSKKGTYNDEIENIAYSVKHKIDSSTLKKAYTKIINENRVVFNQEKIKEVITYYSIYHGADEFINLLFIKTNKQYYGFYISYDYYEKTEIHYKKMVDKKLYKYVSHTMKKTNNKDGWGDPVVMRRIMPYKKTKAKIMVMDKKAQERRGRIEYYFNDIVLGNPQ